MLLSKNTDYMSLKTGEEECCYRNDVTISPSDRLKTSETLLCVPTVFMHFTHTLYLREIKINW